MSKINKMNERFKFLDISKAILIILMVIGHSGAPFTSYIYLFHMAAFIFLSGYTFNGKYPLKIAMVKKIKSLYIPFIKYSLFFLICYNIFVWFGLFKDSVMVWSFDFYLKPMINILLLGGGIKGDGLLGAFWFLTMLIEISMIYLILNFIVVKYLKNVRAMTIICLLIFIIANTILMMGYKLPRFLDNSLIMILIYHAGVIYRQYEDKIPNKFQYALISIFILIFFNQFGSINVGLNVYVNPLFFIISSMSGVYLVLYISKTLIRFSECNFLNYIGKNTLTILALHFFSFKLVSLIIIYVYSYPYEKISSFPVISIKGSMWWFLYSIVGVILPLIIHQVYKYIFFNQKNKNPRLLRRN
ncbi:acyltransferase family protein [uncultured Tenacibaculum sp.]|uniref:acyltransferase family protein n=1 Tax=uncultured Tenacibaculum sp. TaxID=174713 RepID=UPI0026120405|nr:acyltransferase family protein [uncultured Tenacibaculum sp.]